MSSSPLGLPLTIMLASFYWDNAIYFGMGPHRGADGKLALTLPNGVDHVGGEDFVFGDGHDVLGEHGDVGESAGLEASFTCLLQRWRRHCS